MATLKLPANFYRQFDADSSREVPAEGYGGWERAAIEIPFEGTAVVVMHAWAAPPEGKFPGERRAVEYIPRTDEICRTVFPPLLRTVRASGMHLFHVVGGGDYFKRLPGYRRAVELAGPAPQARTVPSDPVIAKLNQFRGENVFPGAGNQADVRDYFQQVDFDPNARPVGEEPVAEDTHQLLALCLHHHISHLVYAGFAIDWCLLMSSGGMLDMSRHGVLCSALRQATTAVENKETARRQIAKEIGLWRVSLAFGFVFDVPDFIAALKEPAT